MISAFLIPVKKNGGLSSKIILFELLYLDHPLRFPFLLFCGGRGVPGNIPCKLDGEAPNQD
jgi:hypothetical protein